MTKKKKTSSTIKDLYLDRPTSHGGWPHGHLGSFRDTKTPVYKQIAKYLEDMGLVEQPDHELLSETNLRELIRFFIHKNLSRG